MTTVDVATDQWAWYRAALNGTIGPIQEGAPQSGFFRHYIGTPVAIWQHDGATIMLLAGEVVEDPIQRGKIWLSVAKTPVRKKDYDARMSTGDWPSDLPEVPAVAKKTEDQKPVLVAEERGPGDNSGDISAYERMRAEVLGDVAESQAYYARNKITDKPAADKASDWGSRLIKMSREANAARLKENEPLRLAIEENDKKWKAVIEPANRQGLELRDLADQWGAAEAERLRKEAQEAARKKWEAEQAEAKRKRDEEVTERARLAAECAAAATVEHDADGVIPEPEPELPDELPLAPPPMPVAPPPKIMLGSGTSGNRRSVRTAPPETAAIVDLATAAAFFAGQNHSDLVTLIQKLADRAIKARAAIPGIHFSWQNKTEAAE